MVGNITFLMDPTVTFISTLTQTPTQSSSRYGSSPGCKPGADPSLDMDPSLGGSPGRRPGRNRGRGRGKCHGRIQRPGPGQSRLVSRSKCGSGARAPCDAASARRGTVLRHVDMHYDPDLDSDPYSLDGFHSDPNALYFLYNSRTS